MKWRATVAFLFLYVLLNLEDRITSTGTVVRSLRDAKLTCLRSGEGEGDRPQGGSPWAGSSLWPGRTSPAQRVDQGVAHNRGETLAARSARLRTESPTSHIAVWVSAWSRRLVPNIRPLSVDLSATAVSYGKRLVKRPMSPRRAALAAYRRRAVHHDSRRVRTREMTLRPLDIFRPSIGPTNVHWFDHLIGESKTVPASYARCFGPLSCTSFRVGATWPERLARRRSTLRASPAYPSSCAASSASCETTNARELRAARGEALGPGLSKQPSVASEEGVSWAPRPGGSAACREKQLE